MSVQHYAEFLSAIGHTVREASGLFWYDAHPRVFTCFPFHALVDPYDVNLRNILGNDGLVARYPVTRELGVDSFRIVCRDTDYDLTSLSGKARNQTRRGLENCTVRQIDFVDLADSGLPLHRDTLQRQGRKYADDHDQHWQVYCRHAQRNEFAEAWAAFVDDQLAAFLIAVTIEEVANVLIVRSARPLLKRYPNNALMYSYLQNALSRPFIREVSIGFESIQQDCESLDRFKLGMGFEQFPVGQRIELSPRVKPLLPTPVAHAAGVLLRRWTSDTRLAKLAGLLEWHSKQPTLPRRRAA